MLLPISLHYCCQRSTRASRAHIMCKSIILLSLLCCGPIWVGCKTHSALPQDHNAVIQETEELRAYLAAIELIEARERSLTSVAGPIPEEVQKRAENRKNAICSDQKYLNALTAFNRVLTMRRNAVTAEFWLYANWSTRDAFGLTSTNSNKF